MKDVLLILSICDALCDLVSFVQFKKRKKHPCGVLLLVTFTFTFVN